MLSDPDGKLCTHRPRSPYQEVRDRPTPVTARAPHPGNPDEDVGGSG
ncbi:hypothetical protein GCM10010230_25520 [Streptomyces narbonensis]|nr:hypothetical protein GCM10010230_25520 [Streptomyces narbonensis]